MDAGSFSSLIANLGFPIACVVAMFFMWNKEREAHKEELHEEQSTHREEMREVTLAINNNTTALNSLVEMLRGGGENGRH